MGQVQPVHELGEALTEWMLCDDGGRVRMLKREARRGGDGARQPGAAKKVDAACTGELFAHRAKRA